MNPQSHSVRILSFQQEPLHSTPNIGRQQEPSSALRCIISAKATGPHRGELPRSYYETNFYVPDPLKFCQGITVRPSLGLEPSAWLEVTH
jgi:hypothetical protein